MGLAVANLVAKPHSVAAPYTAEGGSCPSFCSLQLLPNSPNVAVIPAMAAGIADSIWTAAQLLA